MKFAGTNKSIVTLFYSDGKKYDNYVRIFSHNLQLICTWTIGTWYDVHEQMIHEEEQSNE